MGLWEGIEIRVIVDMRFFPVAGLHEAERLPACFEISGVTDPGYNSYIAGYKLSK
jgi:hypothetical protein